MQLEPLPHLADGPADAAQRVGLRLRPLAWLPAPARVREVASPRGEEPVVEPPVDRARGVARELGCVGADNRGHGLALPHRRGEHGVHLPDLRLVRPDPGARQASQRLVGRLRGAGDVELLRQRAVVLLLAPVADERELGEPVADGLAEVRAGLEALRRVPAAALARRGVCAARALVVVRAEPVRASVALVARDAALLELVPYRRRRPAEVPCDLLACAPASRKELDASPVPFVHVFHGLFSFRVVVRPCGGAPAPGTGPHGAYSTGLWN